MHFFKRSLGRKITGTCLGVFLLGFLAMGALLFLRIGDRMLEEQRARLVSENHLLTYLFEPFLPTDKIDSKIQSLADALSRHEATRITVIGLDGTVLADSRRSIVQLKEMENHRDRPEVAQALRGENSLIQRTSFSLKMQMLYSAMPVRREGKISGVVRLALPLTTLQAMVNTVREPLLAGFVIAAIFAVLAGLWLGRSLTAQLRQLELSAHQVAAGDLRKRIYVETEDELKRLGESFNQLALSLRQRIREAEDEKLKLSAILENITEGILAVDGAQQVVAANAAMEMILGVPRQKIIGRSLLEAVLNHKVHSLMEEAFGSAGLVHAELEWAGPPARTLRASAVGIQDPASKVRGILVLGDVTQIRRLENTRRDFVANVSHELKTPLTSIKGFIETLLGGALNDRLKSEHFLRLMDEDTARLTRLIQDILNLSRLESGQAPLKCSALNVTVEAAQALEKMRTSFEEKKMTAENRMGPALPAVWADRDKLAQIFLNLLDNAVKFNPEGGHIVLSAEPFGERLKISISDTGPGIAATDLPRIFERFFRVDRARSRETGGTGLGLAIVKHLTEAHGGEAGCKSTLGRGATFFFTLKTASENLP